MPPETDNLRLEELFAADQADRANILTTKNDLAAVQVRDEIRRKEVTEMMTSGQINTATDLYRAAVVFLHGTASSDYAIAHRLAVIASIMGHAQSRWLTAASFDRLLMSLHMPQIYGTQFEHNSDENQYQLRLPIDDSTVMHFEKRFFSIPSVIERLAQLNRRASS